MKKTLVGTAIPPTGREHGLALLHDMLRIRRFEQKCAELYAAGALRTLLQLHTGEEAVTVGAMRGLSRDDTVVAVYREHGHALVRGLSMNAVLSSMFGSGAGVTIGLDHTTHLLDLERRFYGGDPIACGGLPLATGMAISGAMDHCRRVTACFFSAGTVHPSHLHEATSMAWRWQLPLLFVCENGVEPPPDYQMTVEVVDGTDVLAVEAAARAAAAAIRNDQKPRFLDCRTLPARDPLAVLTARLTELGHITPELVQAIETSVAEEVAAAALLIDDART